MSAQKSWKHESVPFWQESFELGCEIVAIKKYDHDHRYNWPISYMPDQDDLMDELEKSRSSYIKITQKDDRFFIGILSGRVVVNITMFGDGALQLNQKMGLEYATNDIKTRFVQQGLRCSHKGIFLMSGQEFRREPTNKLVSAFYDIAKQLILEQIPQENQEIQEEELSEAEISKLETTYSTLTSYIELEHELEEEKAIAQKPFVYTNLKPYSKNSPYKYYFELSLIESSFTEISAINPAPRMLKLRLDDDEYLDIEVFSLNKSAQSLVISVGKQVDKSMLPNDGELVLAPVEVLKNVRLATIDELKTKQSPNKWLGKIAADIYDFPSSFETSVPEYNEKYPLLPAQKSAVQKGASLTDLSLVLGPPGTGKTTVILSWAKFFASRGLKVLVASQNNKAVDNVLERLAKDKDLECLRVGNASRVSSSVHHLLIENYSVNAAKKLASNLEDLVQDLEKSKVYLENVAQNLSLHVNYSKIIKDLKKLIEKSPKLIQKAKKAKDKAQMQEQKISQDLALITKIEKSLDYLTQDPKSPHKSEILDLYKSRFVKFWIFGAFKTLKGKIARAKKELDIVQEKHKNAKEILQKTADELSQKEQAPILAQKALDENKERPKLLDFTPCEFVNDDIYKNLSKKTDPKKIMQVSAKDLTLYAQILDAVKSWQNDMKTDRQSSLYKVIIEYVDVVGATCIGINTDKNLSSVPFDVAIIDESGQIELHNLMVPLSRAPAAILVGDHKQLPPVVNQELQERLKEQEINTEFLEKSFFEILWDKMPTSRKTMLDIQFRCPNIISDFVSQAFYYNAYFAGDAMKLKTPLLDLPCTMIFLDTSTMKDNLEKTKQGADRQEVAGNPLETKIILSVLKAFIDKMPELANENEIGVIVPYANHVQEAKRAIKKAKLNLGNLVVEDLVASVDSYQGQERDLIIFAFSRSNAKGSVGFLSDWRRLNVAVTRTKKQLVMIGNMQTLSQKPTKNNKDFKDAMALLASILKDKNALLRGDYFFGDTNA